MPTLEIKQIKDLTAKVDFEGGEWTVDFQNPFTPRQEEELRWYFEDHLNFPMLEIPRAEHAAASIEPYGNRLFNSLFSDRDLHAAFKEHRSGDVRINITGSPDFHRLHWEALWEPGAPNPLAYRTAITRRVATENTKKIRLTTDQPTIRVLVVVARPGGADDVGYRTISRPLVETLHQASLAVELDFLRPGTFAQLKKHLSNKPQGHYHAIHFDGHGAVTTTSHIEHLRREGKLLFHAGVDSAVATPNQSRAAYLFFESPAKPGNAEKIGDAVPAVEVAKLVNDSQVPVVILNACQSGKQEAEPETNPGQPSRASRRAHGPRDGLLRYRHRGPQLYGDVLSGSLQRAVPQRSRHARAPVFEPGQTPECVLRPASGTGGLDAPRTLRNRAGTVPSPGHS